MIPKVKLLQVHLVVILLSFQGSSLFGQDSSGDDPKFTAQGYLKDMISVNFAGKDSTLIDNLIHHRLNLAWYPDEKLTVKLQLRNRMVSGGLVRTISDLPGYGDYGQLIDVNNDYADLSWMPVNNRRAVIHAMIDRALVQWNDHDWEITAGRQRINWGMNLAWNPNDLFNSYSFFDFDYEERPGSDALRIKKYTGVASEVEFAIKAAHRWEDVTSAVKYQFNKWNYDIQLIGGVMKNHLALGTGWAGNIQNAGFKGETTYLHSLDTLKNGLIASTSADYSFANSLYLNCSVMYSAFGKQNPTFFLVNSTSQLDIRSISLYRWSSFVQAGYPVHPLVNTGLSVILFPADASLFLNPYVTLSIRPNLDLDIISQLYFSDQLATRYKAQSKMVFVRLKWSY